MRQAIPICRKLLTQVTRADRALTRVASAGRLTISSNMRRANTGMRSVRVEPPVLKSASGALIGFMAEKLPARRVIRKSAPAVRQETSKTLGVYWCLAPPRTRDNGTPGAVLLVKTPTTSFIGSVGYADAK